MCILCLHHPIILQHRTDNLGRRGQNTSKDQLFVNPVFTNHIILLRVNFRLSFLELQSPMKIPGLDSGTPPPGPSTLWLSPLAGRPPPAAYRQRLPPLVLQPVLPQCPLHRISITHQEVRNHLPILVYISTEPYF